MKIIVAVLFLSSVLFSTEINKQIILGSYLVEKNANIALPLLEQKIQENEKLKNLIDINSLEVTSSKIDKYTVVTVRTFKSFTQLLITLKELKKYYKDAFVLSYSAVSISQVEDIQEMEVQAKEEQIAIEEAIIEEPIIDEAILEQDTALHEEFEEANAEIEEVEIIQTPMAVEEKIVDKAKEILKKKVSTLQAKITALEDENSSKELYLILALIGLLISIIVGFIAYNQAVKTREY